MDLKLRQTFLGRWERYFPGADLPIVFFYTADPGNLEGARPALESNCVVAQLAQVRKGRPLCLDRDTVGCGGGKRYLGYVQKLGPNFEYFLSCGIEGEMEGERYKKSPELVRELMQNQAPFKAPAKYILFKRWDNLVESDDPAVVIFFASGDVLSGLFTLANYDEADPNGVIAPMGSGCSSIVQNPYLELASKRPRAVLGMFDVSARPYVPTHTLTFAVPWPKFVSMVENMEESFLITGSWARVRSRF